MRVALLVQVADGLVGLLARVDQAHHQKLLAAVVQHLVPARGTQGLPDEHDAHRVRGRADHGAVRFAPVARESENG